MQEAERIAPPYVGGKRKEDMRLEKYKYKRLFEADPIVQPLKVRERRFFQQIVTVY
jgi:hypothetical protein